MGFGVGEAFALIDQIGPVCELFGGRPEFTNAWRGILVHAKLVAEHFGFNDLEVTAWSGQFFARFQKFCVVHVSPQFYFRGSYMPSRSRK